MSLSLTKKSIPVIAIILISWFSLNFYTHHRFYTDAGVFAAVTEHVLAGKTLYKDVWDHKPPMIYLINAIPAIAGDGSMPAIRFYERLYAIAGTLAFFFTLRMLFANPWLAFIFSIGLNLHFFNPAVFQGGNITEEYATIFLLMGILFAVTGKKYSINPLLTSPILGEEYKSDPSENNRDPLITTRYANTVFLVSGFFFSLSVFTKEPYLFSALPWFLYIVFTAGKEWKKSCIRGGWFTAGAIIPAMLLLGYFTITGIFANWLDIVAYNYHYAAYSRLNKSFAEQLFAHSGIIYTYIIRQTIFFQLCFLLGLASACFMPFVKPLHYFPWFCLLAFLFDFWSTMISGFEIGHYYLQILPSYLLLSASGLAFSLFLFKKISWPVANKYIWGLILVIFCGIDCSALHLYGQRLFSPAGNPPTGTITKKILELKKPGDTLWAGSGSNAKFYYETKLLSPTKYIYFYIHLFLPSYLSTGQEKRDGLTMDLKEHPPRFVILSSEDIRQMRSVGVPELADWLLANYHRLDAVAEKPYFLYERNEY